MTTHNPFGRRTDHRRFVGHRAICAQRLAQRGRDLILSGPQPRAAGTTRAPDSPTRPADRSRSRPRDLGQPADVRRIGEEILRTDAPSITTPVNNAGVGGAAPLPWDRTSTRCRQ
ncbi:hypothetical protein ACTMU2_31730 [Cupriavidus basilensis]